MVTTSGEEQGPTEAQDTLNKRQTKTQTMRQTQPETSLEAESAELFETASRLRLVVTRTARKMRQEAGGDLTPTSLAALASIQRMAPLTPSELSDIEDVSRPTITRVVNNLFEAGLIRRDPDPRDGRSWLISPTEAGDSYLAERRSRKSAYMAEMLATLEPDEVETLSRAAGIPDAALQNRNSRTREHERETAGAPE